MNKFKLVPWIIVGFLVTPFSLSARLLTYKTGFGYRQAYTNAMVDQGSNTIQSRQVNGLEITYGVAPDMQAGFYMGFLGNFDFTLFGPKFRYNIERLLSRDEGTWKYLNLFVEGAFLGKFGGKTKSGLTLHLPYMGFEVLPFADNNFAISTSAGLVVDLIQENRIGFTNGIVGDVGVKYYF